MSKKIVAMLNKGIEIIYERVIEVSFTIIFGTSVSFVFQKRIYV